MCGFSCVVSACIYISAYVSVYIHALCVWIIVCLCNTSTLFIQICKWNYRTLYYSCLTYWPFRNAIELCNLRPNSEHRKTAIWPVKIQGESERDLLRKSIKKTIYTVKRTILFWRKHYVQPALRLKLHTKPYYKCLSICKLT